MRRFYDVSERLNLRTLLGVKPMIRDIHMARESFPFGPYKGIPVSALPYLDSYYTEEVLQDDEFMDKYYDMAGILYDAFVQSTLPVPLPERWDGLIDYSFRPGDAEYHFPEDL